ncbi:RNA polymerase II-associated protein 3 [Bulinus truncatus]|nr:RNA polymerase II-associated protein 3 [Bulinus truncatus]
MLNEELKQETSTKHEINEIVQEQDKKILATAEKEKGNEYYKNGDLKKALEAYTRGLQFDPTDKVLLSNRSLVFLKQNKFAECEADCTLSLSQNPLYVKPYLRRASARSNLGKLAEAVEDFQRVVELEPNNEQAKSEIERLQKEILKQQIQQYCDFIGIKTDADGRPIESERLYGEDEIYIAGEVEDNRSANWTNCKKNPGHQGFTPVPEFTIQHLPPEYRDNDLYELIKATAYQTVKINVTFISLDRPQFLPNQTGMYPHYDKRGKRLLRVGTGETCVFKFTAGHGVDPYGRDYNGLGNKFVRDYITCPCERCAASGDHKDVWWEILVSTARHVVFDESEASRTTCILFYDDEGSKVERLSRGSVHFVNTENDKCVLKYVTCDDMGEKLFNMSARWGQLRDNVYRKLYRTKTSAKLNYLVSHPHGGPKMITLGEWVENKTVFKANENYIYTQLTYNTRTCPGSSGARVYCVGFGGGHVHGGMLKNGLNYSSIGSFQLSLLALWGKSV